MASKLLSPPDKNSRVGDEEVIALLGSFAGGEGPTARASPLVGGVQGPGVSQPPARSRPQRSGTQEGTGSPGAWGSGFRVFLVSVNDKTYDRDRPPAP